MSDSFESIIADSRCTSCTYAHRRGKGPVNRTTCRGCMFGDPVTCHEEMQRDLLRRCKDVASGIRCERGDNAGGSVNIGKVATFLGVNADKAQALKVLEEAAEAFGAWQYDDIKSSAISRWRVLAECADVIQATCNLIAGMGVVDFTPYVEECRIRNEERGRFDG